MRALKSRFACFVFGGFAGAALTLAVVGYAYLFVSTVSVYNESGMTLSNVQVTLGGNKLWSGTLAPGKSHFTYGEPERSGTVSIVFDAAGNTVHQEFGYVTPGISERHVIFVMSPEDVRYNGL